MTQMTWEEAVLLALNKHGGKGSPVQLYPLVVKIMEPNWLPEHALKHRIRSALDTLKNRGKVDHVDAGVWMVKGQS